ncbi:hypothetical protein RHGRI_021031 [Rhododendron griersonianum]|uniref:Uncharacterized protein n=1 Tax=Rhododendron griersonianum TaxID=479676 RepID=A0AAV6JIL0_9ERIC|nr:hypothetical protein RHGRI_021031 [Rhododendron griersonianum]
MTVVRIEIGISFAQPSQQLIVVNRYIVNAGCYLSFDFHGIVVNADLKLIGSEMNGLLGNENTVASLWLRVRCPVEANPSWRWSFCQPWKDISSESTDSETMDELHACQSLLVIISNVIGKKSLHSQFLSHQDLENCGLIVLYLNLRSVAQKMLMDDDRIPDRKMVLGDFYNTLHVCFFL